MNKNKAENLHMQSVTKNQFPGSALPGKCLGNLGMNLQFFKRRHF